MKVYLVLHHEIFGQGEGSFRADEMLFYTASTFEKAMDYIKHVHAEPFSWWEVQEQKIDNPNFEWPVHVGYYGRRAGKLKHPPYAKSLAIYKKAKGLK